MKDSDKINECSDRFFFFFNKVRFLGIGSKKVINKYKHKKLKVGSLNNLDLVKKFQKNILWM